LLNIAAEDPQQTIRIAAVNALTGKNDARIASRLIGVFTTGTPPLRRAILDTLLSETSGCEALLEAIDAARIRPTELDRPRADRLLRHREEGIRARAKELLATVAPDRREALKEYQAALKLPSDPLRGRAVFQKHCATCHRVAGIGTEVAPDIADSRIRQPEQLLTDIIQPNRAIDANYLSFSVVTTDGRIHTGLITAETGGSITLRQQENKTQVLARDEIEEIRSNGVSLMPEGLEREITVQQMADLISFIKNWRYLDGNVPLAEPVVPSKKTMR
jgi:putative heme-binding domain-containing protein